MKLTGKAKEEFQSYLWANVYTPNHWEEYNITFSELTPAMQWGVLVDFFDSVGIYLVDGKFGYRITTENENIIKKVSNTRAAARTAAIEKANEIYNSL